MSARLAASATNNGFTSNFPSKLNGNQRYICEFNPTLLNSFISGTQNRARGEVKMGRVAK